MLIKRRRMSLAIPLFIYIFISGAVYASEIIIIANPNINEDKLTRKEIENIFLGTTTKWPDGTKIIFATMKKEDIHVPFLKLYIKKSAGQFEAFWRRQLFTGKGSIPKSCTSDQQMIDFVAQHNGAIGYVSSSAVLGEVKQMAVIDN